MLCARLFVFSFLIVIPVFGQSSSTDSQTLQALLAEIRQLRHELQTTTIAAQRAQILLYRLQTQEAIVARASQRLDEARSKLTETQTNRNRLAENVRQNEELVNRNEISPEARKGAEDILPSLRMSVSQLEVEEQQRHAAELEAEHQLQTERTKLADLEEQLERIDRTLERSDHQAALDSR